MAKISGEDGACTYDSGAVKITNWTVEETADVQETTDSGSSNVREYIGNGFTGWTASFEGFVETGDAGGEALGSSASLVLTAASGVTWTGNAIITGATTTLTVAGTDAVKIAYTAQGTGALTKVNA